MNRTLDRAYEFAERHKPEPEIQILAKYRAGGHGLTIEKDTKIKGYVVTEKDK